MEKHMSDMPTARRSLPGKGGGRSTAVAADGMVWALAAGTTANGGTRKEQFAYAIETLTQNLEKLGSRPSDVLKATVYFADIDDRHVFEEVWLPWVGDNPQYWPQRMAIGCALPPQTVVVIDVVAVKGA